MNSQVWAKRSHALSQDEGLNAAAPSLGVFSGRRASVFDLEEEGGREAPGPYCIPLASCAPFQSAQPPHSPGLVTSLSFCLILSFLPLIPVSCYF